MMYSITTNYKKFHEKEIFILQPKKPLPVKKLREILLPLDFKEIDDFFSLKRNTKSSPWESEYFITIDVFDQHGELYLEDDDDLWVKLQVSYLFAMLPIQLTSTLLTIIFSMAEKLNLTVYHNFQVCTRNELKKLFIEYQEDVRANLGGEPGSEDVLVNIQNTYPRK